MTQQKVKFGIVGAGNIAQTYAQVFETCDQGELVAVADIRKEAAEALGERAKCQCFNSYQAMAESVEMDAVIICTPPSTHAEISIYFLERRIHVLCEKPLSISVESAKQMQVAAEKSGATLTMASKFRYVEDVVRAKSIVTSGIIGEIVSVENVFTTRVDMSNRWYSDPAISGGGVLIDNGTHSVDIMRYFLGSLAEVQAVEGKRVQNLPIEDTVKMIVKSSSGVVGNIDLSWSINRELDYYIQICGSQGTISVGWEESKYYEAASQDWVVFGRGYNKIQAFLSQMENFSQAIRDQEPLLITDEDAIASVEVIAAAYTSMNHSRWIPIIRNS